MIPSTTRPGLFRRAALASVCVLALQAGLALSAAPARAQEAATAVQDVEIGPLGFVFGDTTVSAEKVTVSGTRLSKDDLLAILRSDSKEPWTARLRRLDAGSLTIPALRTERSVGGRRQSVIYKDVWAKGVHGGRIAELTASGATLAIEGGGEGETKVPGGTGSYGKIRAEEVDLTALSRLYAEAGDGKGPWLKAYAGFSVDDVAFTDDRGTVVRVAHTAGRDLAGRQIPATWGAALGALTAPDLAEADAARRGKVAGMSADLAEAVSVGSVEATGFSVHETKGEAPIDIAAERLAYAAEGAEAGTSLSGLTFASGATRGSLAKLSLSGFSLAPTIAALRRIASDSAQAPKPGAGGEAKEAQKGAEAAEASEADLRRLTPMLGTLTLTGLALEVPAEEAPAASAAADPLTRGRELAQKKPAEPLRIGLRGGTLSFGPPKDGVPAESRIALTGLTLPASAVSGVPGLGSLGFYGYRDLDLDLGADTAWDEPSKELKLSGVTLSGKDMGRLRIDATLGGIGPEVFDPDAAVSGFAMLSATAKALDLTLENGGLFDRFITAQAKHLSLKPDELRKEYVTASVIGVPVILGNSAAAKAIGAAMGKFVTKPGTLSISAKAKNGAGLGVVDFSTAPTPAAVLDKLEVNAKAE
ncbi:hypothetical protein [Methylobacterium organophilum]|uniref:AsmA-like C-terminal domain-containing protein n=1 Tax=Methylobacterium organophilum TaxID=410 RepID=A0ABQ4T915_METOR|nr:hypothetical protein [Methylobacterium organophilum]GJE27365.1 hypothetical protein LKMONMHP_2223 [Methylobacterium organophilum]